MEYKDMETGKTHKGYWQHDDKKYDGETLDGIFEDMWANRSDGDMESELAEAVDDEYTSASELFNHLSYGNTYDDICEEMLEKLHDEADELECGCDYDLCGWTFEWVEEEEPMSDEERKLEELKESVGKLNELSSTMTDINFKLCRLAMACVDAGLGDEYDRVFNAVASIVVAQKNACEEVLKNVKEQISRLEKDILDFKEASEQPIEDVEAEVE